jgi:aminopeptidase N
MSKNVKRLFEGFRPEHYTLSIDPNRDTKKITGTVTVTGKRMGRPSQRLTFHQHGLAITKASIVKKDKNGSESIPVIRINHQKSLDEVRLHTEAMLYSGSYEVTMTFEGVITDAMHGVYPCYYELNGQKQALIATQFESHHAREAFPCIDEPEAKATFDLTITSPKGESVLGNTPIKGQNEQDGQLLTTFETTPKMSTYLLAFAYGDLQYKEATTAEGVTVRLWATKAQRATSLDFGVDVATRCIEFFNAYFDVPYPLAKSDLIALPDFSSGAMENWGLITFREIALLADPETASQSSREMVATVICHELSHQWFGNLVTMRWWDDLWLNESFANVMEYVATDALFPEWDIWNSFITQEGLSSLRRDSIAGVQAVKTEVHHPDEIASIFDPSIVYAKGGRLIRMLMQYLGEETFRKGLKRYFTKHAYSNTTGQDLWLALGAASGKDVAAFMEPWLDVSGYPVITVDQTGAELTLRQKQFLLDASKADPERLWPVPLLSDRQDVPATLHKRELHTTLKTNDFIRINQGASGHYVVKYLQPAHIDAITNGISDGTLGIAERLMLLSDSSMLARAGEQSFAETLTLLEKYQGEDREPVWDIMALILADCRRFIDADASLEAPIKQLVRDIVSKQFKRLGWQEATDEPVQDTKLRAIITSLGTYAEDPEIVAGALQHFNEYKTNPASVPSELRSIIFGTGIRTGEPGAFEYLLDLDKKTNNVDLQLDITSALTLTKKESETKLLLARLTDASQVRPQDMGRWVAYMLRNRYSRTLTWQWLRDNWEWIEKTFEGDKSYDYFPRYAAGAFSTRELLAEYKAFFEPKQIDVALTRNIVMGIEELNNRITWLERDLPSVAKALKN